MNIFQHLERAAIFFPDKKAVLFEDTSLSYNRLKTDAKRLAQTMQANGIGKGDRVALYLPNIPAFAVCYYAAVSLGAIAVSVNAMLKSVELKYILNDSGAILVCTTGELLSNLPLNACPDLKTVLVCEGDSNGNPTLEQWVANGTDDGVYLDLDPDDPAVLLLTRWKNTRLFRLTRLSIMHGKNRRAKTQH